MSKQKRFHNVMRNSSVALIGQMINILFGFVVRSIFIHKLGKEYLGVNGVMESVLAILSITELGIGTSIAFALYKPVNDGDKAQIGKLMAFYRRTYHVIGALTFVVGLLLIPFMQFFTKSAENVEQMNLIYFLFLANTSLSYFFAYKRTLLSAYQEYYINSLCDDIGCFVKYVLQAVVLLLFSSYIGYLLIHLVCVLGANILISMYCSKKHGFSDRYQNEKLSKEDKNQLKTSVVSLMYQRVGAKLVMGTDNLMISYISIAAMGIYSNYSMVINTIARVLYSAMHSMMGSIGNLLVQDDRRHKYKVYRELVFAGFCCYFVISAVLAGCLERFIALWAGDMWLLPKTVTFAVVLNFFLNGMRQPNVMIIETSGLFNKMRKKTVAEVLTNLVVSFLFLAVFRMGIYGVLFGTTVSMVGVCIWWEGLYVHKYTFGVRPRLYALRYIKYVIVAAIGCFASYFLCSALPFDGIPGLICSGMLSAAIAIGLILLIYGKSIELTHLKSRLLKR